MIPDWLAAGAAWAAVVVSIVAAVYTTSQARTAKRALVETQKAREAAEDQAESARASVQISRAAARRAEAPTFDITLGPPEDGECVVHIRMTGGPAQIDVRAVWTARAYGPAPGGGGPAPERITSGASPGNPHRMVRGDQIELFVNVLVDEPVRVSCRVILESRAADFADDDPDRRWEDPQTVKWTSGPPQRTRLLG